jgi:hypothetical protein
MSIRRREFIAGLGGVAAWPLVACTRQDDRVRALQMRVLRLQAEAAAYKIGQFVKEIESQVRWTTQLPWSAGTLDQRRFDGLRLLRQVPAIIEVTQLDSSGMEQLHVSRLAMEHPVIRFRYSQEFTEAVAHRVYYGPPYLHRQSEPFMTLSVAGTGRDAGVTVVDVGLKLVWDLVRDLKNGERGVGYILDDQGRVVAHSDFLTKRTTVDAVLDTSLFQRDFSALAHVQTARAAGAGAGTVTRDINDHDVLVAYATVRGLGLAGFRGSPS